MPTLVQIAVEGNIGSTGTIAEAIGLIAIQNGWKSYIAHGRFPRPSASELIRIGSDFEVMLHGLETRLFDRHGLGSINATKNLIKKLEKIKPDIIHLHHLHGYYINCEILFDYLKNSKVQVVWTFHDCWAMTGHCCHFDHIGCLKWKSLCMQCPQIQEYPASLFVDRSKKNFILKKRIFNSLSNLTIVSVSKWLDSVVKESFLSAVYRKVIYNGVDTKCFNPISDNSYIRKRFPALQGKIILLGVSGVWNDKKGFNDFKLLSKQLNNDEVIILVGLSKNQINGLPINIIGIEKTENQNELKNLYVTADIFLNLSVEETFGLTTAEALACGTPAIVYDSTACPEIIDTQTGVVVPKRNFIKLREAINEIMKNGKSVYSSKCRDRALKFFEKTDRYNEYFNLYKLLLQ